MDMDLQFVDVRHSMLDNRTCIRMPTLPNRRLLHQMHVDALLHCGSHE